MKTWDYCKFFLSSSLRLLSTSPFSTISQHRREEEKRRWVREYIFFVVVNLHISCPHFILFLSLLFSTMRRGEKKGSWSYSRGSKDTHENLLSSVYASTTPPLPLQQRYYIMADASSASQCVPPSRKKIPLGLLTFHISRCFTGTRK